MPSKFNKLYKILKCPIFIPINDMEAWDYYPKYRWIYNKIELCLFQNVKCAPMPIEPDKYPVIIKPITNLYGMGLNIAKVKNIYEFYDHWLNNNFWMPFQKGEHLSYDIILFRGKIKFHTCFLGRKSKKVLGEFKYWKSVTRNIPKIVKKLIKKHFKSYYGCLNVELIGNVMIEAHLRVGDTVMFPNYREILQGLINVYMKKKYIWKNIKLNTIYFFPLWIEKGANKNVTKYLKQMFREKLKNDIRINEFRFDNLTMACPGKHKRIMWITCWQKSVAIKWFKKIKKELEYKYKYKLHYM